MFKKAVYTSIVLFTLLLGQQGCGSTEVRSYQPMIDSIEIMLSHANENLAIDPEQLRLRVDTMEAKLTYIDSLVPGLAQRADETGIAYNTYVNALGVFKEYNKSFDALLFENQALRKKFEEMKPEAVKLGKGKSDDLDKVLLQIKIDAYNNYLSTRALIRLYLDVARPYQRKKKIIDHLFLGLVENNSKEN